MLGLLQWRSFGRLGRAGAGLAFGVLITAGLASRASASALGDAVSPLPLWRDTAYLVAPFLLPLLAAFASTRSWAASPLWSWRWPRLPVLSWPGAIVAVFALLAAVGLPYALQRWAMLRDDRRFIYLGYLPGLLLIPAGLVAVTSRHAPPLILAFLAHGPVLIGMIRLLDVRGRRAGAATASPTGQAQEELKAAPSSAAPSPICRKVLRCSMPPTGWSPATRPIAGSIRWSTEMLVIGATYGDLVRANVLRDQPAKAPAMPPIPKRSLPIIWRGTGNCPRALKSPGPNGGTLLVIESKTADGGTLRLMTDVTAIKGRESRLTELAQRNEVLATAVGAVSTGILICDATKPEHPVTFVNAAFSRITGYPADEIIGRNCRILQGRDTDPRRSTACAARSANSGRSASPCATTARTAAPSGTSCRSARSPTRKGASCNSSASSAT